jgi:phosphatidylinositol glycan class V
MRYWTLPNAPYFLLVAPILAVSFLPRNPATKRIPAALYIHHIAMTLLLIFSSHIQIALRTIMGDPVVWWNVAGMAVDGGRVTGLGRAWIAWSVVWGSVSLVLWAGHYPPA